MYIIYWLTRWRCCCWSFRWWWWWCCLLAHHRTRWFSPHHSTLFCRASLWLWFNDGHHPVQAFHLAIRSMSLVINPPLFLVLNVTVYSRRVLLLIHVCLPSYCSRVGASISRTHSDSNQRSRRTVINGRRGLMRVSIFLIIFWSSFSQKMKYFIFRLISFRQSPFCHTN